MNFRQIEPANAAHRGQLFFNVFGALAGLKTLKPIFPGAAPQTPLSLLSQNPLHPQLLMPLSTR